MSYTEIKRRNGNLYYYRVRSVRKGTQIRKTRKYLGVNLNKRELRLAESHADRILNGKTFIPIPRLSAPFLEIAEKNQLSQKSWLEKGVHGVLHYFFPAIEQTLRPTQTYFGLSPTVVVFFIHDDYIRLYWNNEDMSRLRKHIIDKVNKNPKELDKLVRVWKERINSFEGVMRTIDKSKLDTLSDKELLDLYSQWYLAYLEEYALAASFQEAFSLYSDDFLKPHFKEILEKKGMASKFDEYYTLLTAPTRESFISQEYRDRLQLLVALKKDDGSFQNKLMRHARRYHWIRNNYAKDFMLEERDFLKLVHEIEHLTPLRELKRMDQELKIVRANKQKIIRELGLGRESRNLIRITEVFGAMQDERKKYVLIASHYQNLFIKEVAKRLAMDKKDLLYSYFYEIKEAFTQKKKIDIEQLSKRKEATLAIFTLEGYKIISGAEATRIHHAIFGEKVEEVNEIHGNVASKGSAQGVVKIVRKTHDFINFQEGDILVTSMTRPEMVIIMEKAGAIVTDEGGITCHAAIVSRELNKPCIIGTKISTKVLKDGDVVSVDAHKGIIKILKRK